MTRQSLHSSRRRNAPGIDQLGPVSDGLRYTPMNGMSGSSMIAIALSQVILMGAASAQTQPTSATGDDGSAEATSLERVRVEETVSPDTNPHAEPGAPYVSNSSADPRRTRALSETPQTIQVLTNTQIEESGRTDLREILDGQPGITLGTGENGNAFGDRYIIRGHEARSDMFVDGLRDPGMTIREKLRGRAGRDFEGAEFDFCRPGYDRRRSELGDQAAQH